MRFFFILLVLFGFNSYSYTQETLEFPMKESSLLWKIEGKDLKQESYLFGTMHLIEKEYFLFPPKLNKLVKKSEVLVMELPGLPKPSEALKLVTLTKGSFFDYFNVEQTDSILVWAKKELNMSEELFRKTMNKMKPFAVVQMSTQNQFLGKTESYEMKFEDLAENEKIEILGLETMEQQIGFFDSLPKADQTKMVMDGIKNTNEASDLIKKMEQLYVRQNVDSLYMIIENEGGFIEENQATFLDDRNKRWLPKIEEIISSKKAFIAVGAGHLGGPNGIIRLLQKEGYTITPVEL